MNQQEGPLIVFGTALFGKVDRVPGVGHVATQFFHVYYLPLIPKDGWLVFSQQGKTWRGVRIPISGKSFLIAWVRVICALILTIGICVLLDCSLSPHAARTEMMNALAITGTAIGSVVFTYLFPPISRASYKRAFVLARHARLDQQALKALADMYGIAAVDRGFEVLPTKPTAAAPRPVKAIPSRPPENPNG